MGVIMSVYGIGLLDVAELMVSEVEFTWQGEGAIDRSYQHACVKINQSYSIGRKRARVYLSRYGYTFQYSFTVILFFFYAVNSILFIICVLNILCNSSFGSFYKLLQLRYEELRNTNVFTLYFYEIYPQGGEDKPPKLLNCLQFVTFYCVDKKKN